MSIWFQMYIRCSFTRLKTFLVSFDLTGFFVQIDWSLDCLRVCICCVYTLFQMCTCIITYSCFVCLLVKWVSLEPVSYGAVKFWIVIWRITVSVRQTFSNRVFFLFHHQVPFYLPHLSIQLINVIIYFIWSEI